jgi:uncharacterized membrane protein
MRASKRRRNNPTLPSTLEASAEDSSLVEVHSAWQGPVPPPAVLADFNGVVEGGAERVFRQWELETEHRRNYERKALSGRIWLDGIGRATAFVFAISALAVTAYAAFIGQPLVAAVLGGGTIAAVTTALVYRSKLNDREETSVSKRRS